MKNLSLISLIICSMLACSSKKKLANMNPDELIQVLELQKTACFGVCPVFTLKIYDNGLAILDGQQNINPIGLSQKLLDKNEMKMLMAICDKAELFSLKNSYMERIMDVPTTKLTYINGDTVKKITGNANFPDGFKKVVKACMEMIDKGGWTIKEAYNTK